MHVAILAHPIWLKGLINKHVQAWGPNCPPLGSIHVVAACGLDLAHPLAHMVANAHEQAGPHHVPPLKPTANCHRAMGLPQRVLRATAVVVGPTLDQEICKGLEEMSSGVAVGHRGCGHDGPRGGQRLTVGHLLTTLQDAVQERGNLAAITCLVGNHGPMACGPHGHGGGPESPTLGQPPSPTGPGHTANGPSGISKEHLEAINNRMEQAMARKRGGGPLE